MSIPIYVCSMWCNSMYIIHYFALYISFIYGRTFLVLSDYFFLARRYHTFSMALSPFLWGSHRAVLLGV